MVDGSNTRGSEPLPPARSAFTAIVTASARLAFSVYDSPSAVAIGSVVPPMTTKCGSSAIDPS